VSLTLNGLLALADQRLGSRKAVMRTLQVSRQRLYSAGHDGPPLRAERLVRLAVVTGVAPGEALRAGGQHVLAALLDDALREHMPEATTPQRVALRHLDNVSAALQRAIEQLQRSLASGDGTEPGDTTAAP
jgi:hypothetical protein